MDASREEGATVRREIDVTRAGALAYENAVMAMLHYPAHGIAAGELRLGEGDHPTARAVQAMRLETEAQQLEWAIAVLRRLSLRHGLPIAAIVREGPAGLKLAARTLAQAA